MFTWLKMYDIISLMDISIYDIAIMDICEIWR
jgi:hypothetical protein